MELDIDPPMDLRLALRLDRHLKAMSESENKGGMETYPGVQLHSEPHMLGICKARKLVEHKTAECT